MICQDFLPLPMRGSHVKSDSTYTVTHIHSLVHLRGACALSLAVQPFSQFLPNASCRACSPTHTVVGRLSLGRRSKLSSNGCINFIPYICTRALNTFLSCMNCRSASTVIPLLPKVTFTRSIQPNFGLPCPRVKLSFAIDTLLAIRYSSIFSSIETISTLSDPLPANYLLFQLICEFIIINNLHS